jgi:hypothetical protein
VLKSQPWFNVSPLLEGSFFAKISLPFIPQAQSIIQMDAA